MFNRPPTETLATLEETLEQASAALEAAAKSGDLFYDKDDPADVDAMKAEGINIASGLTAIDLSGPLRTYPFLTPLRNQFPRIGGGTGVQPIVRGISSLNQGRYRSGVPEGKRNRAAITTVFNISAPYKVLDTEDQYTWESREAAVGLMDIDASTTLGVLQRHMLVEERMLLGGNATLALGQVLNVSVSDVGTGGTIAAGTDVKVAVVALTMQGLADAGFTGLAVAADFFGGGTGASVTESVTPIVGAAFNRQGFCGQLSAVSDVVVASDGNNTHSITVSWTAIAGAVAYAVFWGPTGTSAMGLGYISPINSMTITTAVGASTAMYANATGLGGDTSTNQYDHDGVISIIAGTGQATAASDLNQGAALTNTAYVKVMPTTQGGSGGGLHSNGAGGIVEWDTALQAIYEGQRGAGTNGNFIGVDEIMVSSADIAADTNLCIAGGSAPIFRMNLDAGVGITGVQQGAASNGLVHSGVLLVGYLSKWGYQGPKGIKVSVHPNLPQGTSLFLTYSLPYQQSGVQAVLSVRTRRDTFQVVWPEIEAQKATSVRASQVLICHAQFALGAIFNQGPTV